MTHEYLTVVLGGREYAIPIQQVREIVTAPSLTRVPATPRYVRGVFSLVGEIIPVLDIAVHFGGESTALGKRTCVMIADVEVHEELTPAGVLVERIGEIVELPLPLNGAVPSDDPIPETFLSGNAHLNGRVVPVFNLGLYLASLELFSVTAPMNRVEAA